MAADHVRIAGGDDAGGEAPGQSSDDRDRIADDRDQASEVRERAAETRDGRAEARDRAAGGPDGVGADDRAEALRDRRGAAGDRVHAAADRRAALSDRAVSTGERVVSSIDGLTGAHRRDAGALELERDRVRAKRTAQTFVLAFIDVDGLKVTNDSVGHAAGDRLLRLVVDTTRAHFRSYDLIVRLGGDEFVCGLTDLTMRETDKRFVLVNADLQEEARPASVTVGLAEAKEDESLEELIARADQAMYSQRQQP